MSSCKVVILNWNGRKNLEKFLPSVVSTTSADIGIVVADNGSTDDSVAWVRENFPQIELVLLDHNYGYAGGYNIALDRIESDYFILLNSDVETTPGWCDILAKRLDAEPSLAALSPKILSYTNRGSFEYAGACGGFIDSLGYPFCRGRILSVVETDCGQYDDARDIFWASGACMIVRSSVFRKLGGFDSSFFAHMEEIDLCWRMQMAGYRVGVDPRSVVYHLGGGTLPNNNPRKLYLNYRNNLSMLYKNLPKGTVELVLLNRMLLDALSSFVFLAQGRPDFFGAVWRAHWHFHKRRPELKRIRRDIHSRYKYRSIYIYPGFIILRYILGLRRFGNMI